jgi:hypothetical protein
MTEDFGEVRGNASSRIETLTRDGKQKVQISVPSAQIGSGPRSATIDNKATIGNKFAAPSWQQCWQAAIQSE